MLQPRLAALGGVYTGLRLAEPERLSERKRRIGYGGGRPRRIRGRGWRSCGGRAG